MPNGKTPSISGASSLMPSRNSCMGVSFAVSFIWSVGVAGIKRLVAGVMVSCVACGMLP